VSQLPQNCATSRATGEIPDKAIYENLRILGEVGVKVSNLYGLPEKIPSKGSTCLCLGNESNYPRDTYRELTKSIKWPGMTFGE
jgi:hypothetical protein